MIYNAIAFMEKNNCDISELAKLSLMSQSTFYTTFKRITGFTPNEMKIKIQMQKAEALLRTTNLSIDEIASHIGYSSTNYFRRIFKKIYGCTPAEMRKGT